ncbi:MAG: DNA-binding protein WhiA [Clostridia bacterium]|nr:DNA-binding protein WhiA [Clostridia bacterium]
MSFTSEIKDELVRIQNEQSCCDMAQLCGFICFAGSVGYSGETPYLKITTESDAAAKSFETLMKKVFGIKDELVKSQNSSGRGGFLYNYVLDTVGKVHQVLDALGLFDDEFSEHITFKINQNLVKKQCCKRAFIRGAFLGGGSAANPEKSYHLEFVTHHHALSGGLTEVFAYFDIDAKTVKRQSNYVIYFKNSDDIFDVMSVMGAHKKMMEFANVRIVKDKRNNINRKVNCETANLDKTLNAAFVQKEAIKKIKEAGKFEMLPKHLAEVANMRLEHPDASLNALAELLGTKISRSAINHRFKKIIQIAEEITEKNNE